jgi:hypothetical protein
MGVRSVLKGMGLGMFMVVLATAAYPLDAKMGIGVSATESDTSIYVPIKFAVKKKFLLVEPMVTYYSNTETDGLDSYSVEEKESETDVGVGVYLLSPIFTSSEFQIGVRMAYVTYEDNVKVYGNGTSATATNDKVHGYLVAPVIGWNYNFNDHITAGVTVALTYTKLNGDYVDNTGTNPNFSRDVDKYSTDTDIFLKYYF